MVFRFLLKPLLVLLALLLLLGGLGVGGALWWSKQPLELAASPLDVRIEPGSSLRATVRQLQDAGVRTPGWLLEGLGRWGGFAASIKAGSYEFEAGITPWGLLEKLARGDVSQGEVTLVEGLSFRQIRQRLAANPDLRQDSAGLSEAEILRRIGAPETQAEGLFMPDTYLFDKHSSDLAVLRRAYRAMADLLAREWAGRAPNLPIGTPYEALTLASIVEKETGLARDRHLIAAVFLNRLRKGMLLQTDPTVIYGLGETFDGNLRKRDLLADTPYNTYTRGGLPPTPIAMPGRAALQAVLHPAQVDYVYFVARGDGSSEFSTNLDDHNRAVARFQLGRGRP